MKNILLILVYINFAALHSQEETIDDSQIKTIEETETTVQYSPKKIIPTLTYTLSYPLTEYESMIKRCQQLGNILAKFDEKIQNGSITKSQIKEWKKNLVEAKLLNYRLEDYSSIYHQVNYPLLEYVKIESLHNHRNFSKILNNATQYAIGF